MRQLVWLSLTIPVFLMLMSKSLYAQPQSTDPPRYEVSGDFSSISFGGATRAGVGGRFTYNLNNQVALEAAGYFFPDQCEFCGGETSGQITEGLFGIKAGRRFKRWGVFAKARPGFASISRGAFNVSLLSTPASSSTGTIDCFGPNPLTQTCFRFEANRVTPFALDVGGVVEIYPSKRIIIRFDAGDTLLHFRSRTFNTLAFDPNNPPVPTLAPLTIGSHTNHNFQFIGGVGIRF